MKNELQENIAREINELHQRANTNADASIAHADVAVEAAWLCGKKLNEQKESLPHGEWIPWLEDNCPDIHIRKAQRYMGLADKYDTLSHLKEAQRIKALIAAGILPEPEASTIPQAEHSRDTYLLHIQKACQFFNEHDPLTKLNAVGRQVLKEQLRPLVELHNKL